MKRGFRVAFLILPWLVLGLITVWFTLADGWKDVTLGRLHRQANEFFKNTEDVTRIKIFRLSGTPELLSGEMFTNHPEARAQPVFGSVSLEDGDAAEFLECWRAQEVNYYTQDPCHEPAYGFRLYRGTTLIAETTICWRCRNFSLPDAWPSKTYGFNATTEQGRRLLDFCDQRLPYFRPPAPEADKESSMKRRGRSNKGNGTHHDAD